VEPNDRGFDRKLDEKLKRMRSEDVDALFRGENGEDPDDSHHHLGLRGMERDDLSQLTFAEIKYPSQYADAHAEIVTLLEGCFSNVRSGLQGDSWIWIVDADEKVAIDTFSSMTHQVKSYEAGPLVQKVINALRTKFDVSVFEHPREEWG
jgi:hypothetical protein